MRSIRISNEAYDFIKHLAVRERRSLTATLDLFISVFKENGLEAQGVPSESGRKQKI